MIKLKKTGSNHITINAIGKNIIANTEKMIAGKIDIQKKLMRFL